ncbi:hypothetical protein RFI_25966 [Reticulomyxa filosa]|uniref:Uncharacterized protein n=1 Tax=Reticulomyxa filosa TaxID=46433 RepID=X6MEF7_RETFI|nr:hypothetical protein RFI_25966 [Reticulomyxa filosa]|eukprot:ETO11410.1 hypothetical protein RFI_25966 [Reticulomyxa filosa]
MMIFLFGCNTSFSKRKKMYIEYGVRPPVSARSNKAATRLLKKILYTSSSPSSAKKILGLKPPCIQKKQNGLYLFIIFYFILLNDCMFVNRHAHINKKLYLHSLSVTKKKLDNWNLDFWLQSKSIHLFERLESLFFIIIFIIFKLMKNLGEKKIEGKNILKNWEKIDVKVSGKIFFKRKMKKIKKNNKK